ncbi:MAG: AMP-binding protein [Sinimarinibacterium flocculans]|uniref:AMP-binding protein n=1 Tax=Sinimarinibacterium flocculans TaxID=985250 RepID=UPI003C5B461B
MTIDVERLYGRHADNRWERTSVGDLFERVTWSQPDKTALIAAPCAVRDPQFARLSYRQADRIANRTANALLARGCQRGERIALFCDNSVEAFLVKIGIAKAGMVVLPINTMMAPDMIEHALRLTDSRHAIVDAESWTKARTPFEAAGAEVIAAVCDTSGDCHGLPSLSALMATAADTEPDVRIHGDDIWQIMMTSGTTSLPKAVMISHSYSHLAGLNQALAFSRGVAVESDYRMCTFLPIIYHIADQIFAISTMLAGGSLVIGRVPDPAAIADAVSRERPTAWFGGSPQFIADFVKAAEARRDAVDLTSLQVVVFGWAALDPQVKERLARLCGEVMPIGIFGQTECIALHRFPVNHWPDVYRETAPATNVVGLPTPLLASTVMDSEGRSLDRQPGALGEAVYRSPVMTAGYYRDAEATRAAFKHGWFHSGDVCQFRDDGLRVMVDRYKDVVKSGGENVSSLRVEAVAGGYPGVSRVAVIGLPDERWGEAVTAVVVPEAGSRIDEAGLVAFCRERLAGYETPKRVILVDSLPVTVGGKVLKYKLRRQFATTGGG